MIDGFKIDGQGADDAHFGVWCESSTLIISNNTITGYHHGIGSQSSRMTVENNSILKNSSVGIEIVAASTTLIKGNTIADTVDTGIRIALSQDHVSMTRLGGLWISCQCDIMSTSGRCSQQISYESGGRA